MTIATQILNEIPSAPCVAQAALRDDCIGAKPAFRRTAGLIVAAAAVLSIVTLVMTIPGKVYAYSLADEAPAADTTATTGSWPEVN
ncbi:hypothetical protein [Sutterella sp.]|uniref:hypothetical protein n=1 Tax=Sutterella sp. TaxID=1981025 RepID=UPI0026E05308|nr:hypothetical protein [Sutterella sp.]MDO5531556.1 hypothetical protein [Sutterella sp.]